MTVPTTINVQIIGGPRGPRGLPGAPGDGTGGSAVFPGYADARGSWKGYPSNFVGGPTILTDRWWTVDNTFVTPMPGIGDITVPTLIGNGDFVEGSGQAALAGSLLGDVAVDGTLPIVNVPAWARPAADQGLSDCNQFQVQWVYLPDIDGPPVFAVVRTDMVDARVGANGDVTVPGGFGTPPEFPGDPAFASIILNFEKSSWSCQGQPPQVETYGVKWLARGEIDTSAAWTESPTDGHKVLILFASGEGQKPGIYRMNDGGDLTLETDLFDGGHDESVVWYYESLADDNSTVKSGSGLVGIYTSQECSIVELASPPAPAVTPVGIFLDFAVTAEMFEFLRTALGGTFDIAIDRTTGDGAPDPGIWHIDATPTWTFVRALIPNELIVASSGIGEGLTDEFDVPTTYVVQAAGTLTVAVGWSTAASVRTANTGLGTEAHDQQETNNGVEEHLDLDRYVATFFHLGDVDLSTDCTGWVAGRDGHQLVAGETFVLLGHPDGDWFYNTDAGTGLATADNNATPSGPGATNPLTGGTRFTTVAGIHGLFGSTTYSPPLGADKFFVVNPEGSWMIAPWPMSGTGAPDDTLGEDGCTYYDLGGAPTPDVYLKAAGSWSAIGSLGASL